MTPAPPLIKVKRLPLIDRREIIQRYKNKNFETPPTPPPSPRYLKVQHICPPLPARARGSPTPQPIEELMAERPPSQTASGKKQPVLSVTSITIPVNEENMKIDSRPSSRALPNAFYHCQKRFRQNNPCLAQAVERIDNKGINIICKKVELCRPLRK